MRKARTMTDEDRDNIIMLLDKGLAPAQVSSIIGCSDPTVYTIRRIYNLVKDGDVEKAKEVAVSFKNTSIFAWACDRNQVVSQEPKELQPAPPPVQDTSPAKLDDVEAAVHVAAAKLLDGLAPHLEALEKKLDQLATIIQSCAADGRKTVDANTDTVFTELKRQSDLLGAVKMNTKKQTIWRGGAE